MDNARFEKFINTGKLDPEGKQLFVTQASWRAFADMARDEILSLRQGGAAPAPARTVATPAAKPAAVTAPTPAAKPATAAPVASKPALPAAGTVTAAQWQAANAKTTMTRTEWQKLSHPDRNEFIRNGGKLTD